MKDIVQHLGEINYHHLPPMHTIYVVGTGPKGVRHYDRIPRDAVAIGVNKAIMLHGGPPRPQSHDIERRMAQAQSGVIYPKGLPMWLWLCSDVTLPDTDWFKRQLDLHIRCDFDVLDTKNPTVVLGTSPDGEKSLHRRYPGAAFKALHGLHLGKTPAFKPLWPGLRGGATVGAQAVQLAYYMGAHKIILCGIDMSGNKYMDETVNTSKGGGVWHQVTLFNGLCKWIKDNKGVEVTSLSETALDVEIE